MVNAHGDTVPPHLPTMVLEGKEPKANHSENRETYNQSLKCIRVQLGIRVFPE